MKDIDRDRFMTPDEAVAYGLVDEVIQPADVRFAESAVMETGKAVRELSGVRVRGWRVWTVGRRMRESALLGAPDTCGRLRARPSPPVPRSTRTRPPEPVVHAAGSMPRTIRSMRSRTCVDETSQRTLCRVLGEVTLSGRIVETETGWRARVRIRRGCTCPMQRSPSCWRSTGCP